MDDQEFIIPEGLPPPPFMPSSTGLQLSASQGRLTTGRSERLSTGRSEGRLATGASKLEGAETSSARVRAATAHSMKTRSSCKSRASTVASARSLARREASRAVFESMALLSLRDHVACLLQQPLPSKGDYDPAKDYTKEVSVAPRLFASQSLPVAPHHMKLNETTVQNLQRYGEGEKDACVAIKKNAQWHGFQKNNQTAYNEQVVSQSHIMRK
eukprot:TRINITY_DN38227_c0_g1_i1.p1 TRINITY_DN38227_c0_g1~~TRINITY_DN38227_c0_g1_i1.p1  ORF type:complete len:214 (-),score=23.94 TRINITY_DN38227_c0_g1_i1:42-683(-)